MSARGWPLVLATLVVSGCDGQPPRATASVRDSAGIEIVETPIEVLGRLPNWTVTWPPSVDLSDGLDTSRAFYQVRDGAFLSTGEVVLVNAGTSEVFVFSSSGRLLRVLGRAGAGPGEFTELTDVDVLADDSVVALDRRLKRLTVFSPDGALARTVPLEWSVRGNPQEVLTLPDGRFGVAVGWSSALVAGGEPPLGRSRLPQPVHVFHGDGRFAQTAASPPGMEFHSPEPYHWVLPLFPRVPVVGVSTGELIVGPGEGFEFQVVHPSRGLTRIVRLIGGRTVTSLQIDSMKRLRLAMQPTEEARAWTRATLDELPVPETLPPYTRMLVDDKQRWWVSDFSWYGATPRGWTVFDPDGTVVARVEVPPQVHLLDVRGDRVLGVRLDALDVEHPAVLALRADP